MKKILIFLIGIFCMSISCLDAKAATFYEAEKIEGIYTKSVDGQTSHYQKARFFRRTSDNKEAYCLEPFAFFDANTIYKSTNYAKNLDKDTWHKLALIAHYGYGYNNHTDQKWYAITQLMIWQTVEPNKQFYFTSYLNGPKIDIFQNEINEINNLVNNWYTSPNIKIVNTAVVGKTLTLTDTNNVLNNYYLKENYDNVKIENNKLIITNVKEGKQSIIIKRKLDRPDITAQFYYHDTSQNLMVAGTFGERVLNIVINGTTNKVTITKLDEDTNSITPSGDATLTGAIYGLYTEDNELLQKITIDEFSNAILNNLDYGKYYLQEITPGNGYTLSDEKYYFEINQNTTNINIDVKNKVIKKEIIIHKEYGEEKNTSSEENISFDIFNSKGELVDTITTDKDGNAKIILPYGKYTVKQRNTNYGYSKVDDFTIEIDDNNNEYYYKLYDYKIKVPNTKADENYIYIALIMLLIPLPILKKYVI